MGEGHYRILNASQHINKLFAIIDLIKMKRMSFSRRQECAG